MGMNPMSKPLNNTLRQLSIQRKRLNRLIDQVKPGEEHDVRLAIEAARLAAIIAEFQAAQAVSEKANSG